MNTLKAGFARVDITPPLGIHIQGYFVERIADGVLDPLSANALALSAGGKTALVFGKESAGLSREDLARCDLVCEIANPGHLSYNLGMAASIALYELVAEKGAASSAAPEAKRPTLSEVEAFENMLQANLIPDIRNAEARKALIHQLMVRTNPSRIELQSMFGFLKELIGPRKGLR